MGSPSVGCLARLITSAELGPVETSGPKALRDWRWQMAQRTIRFRPGWAAKVLVLVATLCVTFPTIQALGDIGSHAPIGGYETVQTNGPTFVSGEDHSIPNRALPQTLAQSTWASPTVQQTLDIANGSVQPGNYVPKACNGFEDVAVALTLGRVFVTCISSDVLAEFNTTSGELVGTTVVGPAPMGLVFDSFDNQVYVADSNNADGGGSVDVVNVTSMAVTSTISAGCSPIDIAFDQTLNRLFVSDFCDNNVTVISGVNDSVVARIPQPPGSEPQGIAYDTENGNVYVAETGLVGIMGAANDTMWTTENPGGQATVVECNPATGNVYVGLGFQGEVVEISGANGSTLATGTFPSGTPGPSGMVLDPITNRLYATTYGVLELNATSLSPVGSVSVGTGPIGIDYDDMTNNLYVADSNSNDIAPVNASTLTVSGFIHGDPGPEGVAWSSPTQDIYVANEAAGTLVSIDGRTQSILTTTKLAYGITAVTVNDTGGSVFSVDGNNNKVYEVNSSGELLNSVTVGTDPTGLAYDKGNGLVYVANFASNNLTLLDAVNSATVGSISLAGPVLGGGGSQDVTVDSTNGNLFVSVQGCVCGGIPGNVTVVDGTTNRVIGGIYVWPEPGPTALAVDTQNNVLYVTDDYANLLWAFNASTWAFIAAVPVGISPQGVAIDDQTGQVFVTNGKSNNVSVIDSATNQVVGSIAVGLTPLGVAFDPANGNIYVANQGSGTLSVIHQSVYAVTFNETGLPLGTSWNVTLGGVSNRSATSVIGFIEPNGTYPFTIAGIPGWHPISFPWRGSVTVNGSSLEEIVNWTATLFVVTFVETGLTAGLTWNVSLGGTPRSTNNSVIAFAVANNSYSFSVGKLKGYTAQPSNGTLKVNGTDVAVPITFSKIASAVGTFLGLTATSWTVILVVTAAAVVVAMFLLSRKRRMARGMGVQSSNQQPPTSRNNVR